jgi:hypothetical protein
MAKQQIEFTDDSSFNVKNAELQAQGFRVIEPSFPELKKLGDTVTQQITKKSILFGETNGVTWKLMFLHFPGGRVSVKNPELYPIGRSAVVTYSNDTVINNKPAKEMSVTLV